MSLKAYSFIRIDEFGSKQNCYITFESMSFDWSRAQLYASFKNFESQEEASRGGSARRSFTLKLEGDSLMGSLMQPIPKEQRELPFVIIFSNQIWSIATSIPFIPDFSIIDAVNNIRVETLKSLEDLNAELIEIQLG